MKVKDLIKKLKTVNPNANTVFYDNGHKRTIVDIALSNEDEMESSEICMISDSDLKLFSRVGRLLGEKKRIIQ